MYTFNVTVHARPEGVESAQPLLIQGVEVRPLSIASNELIRTFAVTFEQTATALLELPRMFCEPDGYFVWSGKENGRRWQVDGHLYDRADRMLYVLLKGNCPREAFDLLLTALGWPLTPLLFQLVNEAVILGEADFRLWASAPRD